MVAKKKKVRKVLNNAEKSSRAYWKKLEEDNDRLENSLKVVQDKASLLQKRVHSLEKKCLVQDEQLGSFKADSYGKEIQSALFGAAIGYGVENKYNIAAFLAISSYALGFFKPIIRAIHRLISKWNFFKQEKNSETEIEE